MVDLSKCCLCQFELLKPVQPSFEKDMYYYECKRCGKYSISREMSFNMSSGLGYEKIKHTFSGITRYYTNYLRKVTILEKNFYDLLNGLFVPKDIKEKLDLLLYNLGRRNNIFGKEIFGRPLGINPEFDYPLGFCSEIYEFRNMINELVNTNYLKPHEISGSYSLTVEGLIKYNEIKDKYNKINNSINHVTVINSKANKLPQLSKTEKEILDAKKIFISYSRKDKYWKQEMISHLSSLKQQDLISTWHDREIESGYWEPQIEQALEKADIFLFLITHNFISSGYINRKEITTAYSRFKSGKCKIFPVICNSCDWKILPVTKEEKEFHTEMKRDMYPVFGKFQAFPTNAKPIENWKNRHDGFLDVIEQLKKEL